MLVKLWTLLVAVMLVTAALGPSELPTAETIELQLLDGPCLDEVVTEAATATPSPPQRHVACAWPRDPFPATPPLASIFRPPRLPS